VPDPGAWFGPALLGRIADYRTPLRIAVIARSLLEVTVPLVIAATPAGRRLVARIVGRIRAQHPARAAATVVVAIVVLSAAAGVPIGVWAHYHARAFGLSTQSLAGWFGDWAIAVSVEVGTAAVLALSGYALVRRWPRHWHLIAAPLGVAIVAVVVLTAPLVIEPLRFNLRPLPEGEMRRELESVLAADGRPATRLLVADASRRTTTQNAYVSGLWGTRRIVLYDTLLERDPSQVAQVLAHELAHDRNRDLPRGVLAGGVGWIAGCLLVAAVLRWRVARGRQAEADDPHGAGAVVVVLVVAVMLTTPVVTWHSRRAEAAADLGAVSLTGDPATFCAMQRGLVERNLSDPAPPTWQRLWWSTHPPPASRLALAQRLAGGPIPGCVP
jgi:STE24 endopeptidase